jgi:hypothetical protein
MRRWFTRVLMIGLVAMTLLAGTASTATAAGDSALDRRIVSDALPGWTRLPNTLLERLAATERGAVSGATSLPVTVAAEGWSQGTQSIIVVLLEFPAGAPLGDFKPRDAVVGACATSTLSGPKTLQSYAGITGSAEATCAGRSSAGVPLSATVMAWQQQSFFALVIGNRFVPSQLESFAVKQDAALTATSSPINNPSDPGSSVWVVFVIVGVAIVLGLIVFLLMARSRSRMPAPVQALGGPASFGPPTAYGSPTYGSPAYGTPSASPSAAAAPGAFAPPAAPTPPPAAEPGWQPIDGDPTRIAYWDGSEFTARKRWDGSNWVD